MKRTRREHEIEKAFGFPGGTNLEKKKNKEGRKKKRCYLNGNPQAKTNSNYEGALAQRFLGA